MFKTQKQQGLSQPVVVAILMLVALAVVILIWLLSLDVTYQTQETQDQAYEILTGEKPAKPSTGAIEGAYPGNFGSGTAIGGGGIINPGLIPTPGPESTPTPTPTPTPGGGSGGNENPGGNPGSGSGGSGDTPEEPQPTTFTITYDYDGGTVLKHAKIENTGYGYDYYDADGYIFYTSVLPNKESLDYYYESEFIVYDVYTPENSKAIWHEDGKNASINTSRGNLAAIIYEPTVNFPTPGVYVLYGSQYAHSNYFKYLYGPENPKEYSIDTENFKLLNPTKDGYIFKGWIGSNGNTPQKDVSIFKGTRGNLSYKAVWEPLENGTTAFAVYSSDDESLRFYNEENVPTIGSTFKGRKVDAVYLDVIFGESYKSTDGFQPYHLQPPWSEHADSIKNVFFDDRVIPANTDYWFTNFTALENVVLPEGLLYIGRDMFSGCSSLQQISLPDTLQIIGYSAFSGCSSLQSITIPFQVKHIDMNAFYACSSLTTVNFHDDIDMIGDAAFADCTSLETFVAPLNLKYLGRAAFSDCENLKDIKLNDNLVFMGVSCFRDCALTAVTMPKSLRMIGWDAFDYMQTLTDIYYEGTKAEWFNVRRGYHGSGDGALTGYYKSLPIHCTDGDACDGHNFIETEEVVSLNQFQHRHIATCETCGISGPAPNESSNIYHTPETWPDGPEDVTPIIYEGVNYHVWETKCTKCDYEGLYYEPCWFEPVYDGEYVGSDANGHVLKGLCVCGAEGTYGENHTYEMLPGTPAQQYNDSTHIYETVCACGAKSKQYESHRTENGACVDCGFKVTFISSDAPYAHNLSYQVVGTWDYSDAKAVNIEISYACETNYDWYSICRGNDYISGTSQTEARDYISKSGTIVNTTGVSSEARLTGSNNNYLFVENCDFLTGSVIIKTDGSGNKSYWDIEVSVIPIYE